jgi:hypothetical protein
MKQNAKKMYGGAQLQLHFPYPLDRRVGGPTRMNAVETNLALAGNLTQAIKSMAHHYANSFGCDQY